MLKKKSKLKIISDVLHPAFLAKDQHIIFEENTDHKGRKFRQEHEIADGRLDYKLYRYNREEVEIFPFFSDQSALKQFCDYILFAEQKDYLYILLFELKLSNNESAKPQLEAAQEFVQYLIASIRRIGMELDDKIVIRKLRICDRFVNKKKTRTEIVINYDGDSYCDYTYKKIRLLSLID
jgi:hypothetical protein